MIRERKTFELNRIRVNYLLFIPLMMLLLTTTASATEKADTQLDRSKYVSADEYDNKPIDMETVIVGLDYGGSAVEEANFRSCSDEGFYIGHHDSNRNFIPFSQIESSDIKVKYNTATDHSWHIQLKKKFVTKTAAMFAGLKHEAYVEKSGMLWDVYVGNYDTRKECASSISNTGLSGSPYCSSAYCISIIDNISDKEICTFEYGNDSISIQAFTGNGALTDYSDNRYHGSYKISAANNGLTVANYVDIENYVKGVIPYEMSSSWPLEALKAQAVCARTYVVYNKDGYKNYGFDLTDDTYSQVYRGVVNANEVTDRAVDETSGMTVRYEGEVCEIYYSASDGGATENGKNVFNVDLPYLVGVYDPFEDYVNYDIKDWQFKKSGEEISEILTENGFYIDTVTEIVPTLSGVGNVIALSFYDDSDNEIVIRGRRCYNILGLYSCRFSIMKEDNTFVFNGDGWGHNCGMSQYGAKAMASVFNYNYEDIIRFYFRGAYIA